MADGLGVSECGGEGRPAGLSQYLFSQLRHRRPHGVGLSFQQWAGEVPTALVEDGERLLGGDPVGAT
ncbi:hypothetical protein I3W98_40890 [Streptomyces cavourensis]|nr:hypothetical protein [Streptomyces cavourensis]